MRSFAPHPHAQSVRGGDGRVFGFRDCAISRFFSWLNAPRSNHSCPRAQDAIRPATSADAAPKATGEPISLVLPGVRGPETHVYRQMAVHLYMRGS